MKESLEELKCMLQSYDKNNTLKICVIVLTIILAIAAIIGMVVFCLHGRKCCCIDDDFDFEDDFDDDDEETDFED